MEYNLDEINHLIRNRRSIFPVQYRKGARIPKEIIEQLLENANWAPTHGRTEPWRFTVFSGAGLQKLADFQAALYQEYAGSKFDETKYRKLQETPLLASHVISIGMKRDPNGRIPEIEEIEAVACAVQNMHLTATAYGLGAYWTSGGVTNYEQAKTFFNLGENDKLLGFFYIGYIAKPAAAGTRKPIVDKVVWVENE
jgi:nitroreductase